MMRGQSSIAPEIEGLFNLFDHDGDGIITATELERSLASLQEVIPAASAAELRALVSQQGQLRVDQFVALTQDQPCFDLTVHLRALFQLVDLDGSGFLSRDEIGELLQLLDCKATPQAIESLLTAHDHDGSGTIGPDEFIAMLNEQSAVSIRLSDLKRLKKSAMQYSQAARTPRVALVEVDCDLGAGIPGAGSGIDMLKQAAARQESLRAICDSLLADIDAGLQPAPARAGSEKQGAHTPYARNIECIAQVMTEAAGLVSRVRSQGLFPVVLAGDHATAAGTIAGLRRAHPDSRIGVVWIDAHADIHSPFTTPSGNMHGMPVAIAAAHDNHGQAIQQPDAFTLAQWQRCKELAGTGSAAMGLSDLIYVSVRDTEPAEDDALRAHGIPVITTEDVRRNGPETTAQTCLDYLGGCDQIYVSFDVDSMDATICKGTGTPVPGGLWLDEARRINAALLADPRVICWEICEINPHLDTLNTLAEVSLSIYQSVLEVLQRRL